MKGLKKLALASAVLAASTGAFAMEALDDSALSNTTGQSGLTISLSTDVSIGRIRIHDQDGLNGAAVATGGSAVNTAYAAFEVATPDYDAGSVTGGSIIIDKRAGGVAGTDFALQIKTGSYAASATPGNAPTFTAGTTPTELRIDTGHDGTDGILHIEAKLAATGILLDGTRIGVGAGNGSGGITNDVLTFDRHTFLNVGASTAYIDLASQPTGDFLYTSVNTSGIELSSLNILDNAGGGQISLGGIKITGAGGANITGDVSIGVNGNATPATEGLRITQSMAPLDISLNSVGLGAAGAPSIGAVYIDGLTTTANTIYIKGH